MPSFRSFDGTLIDYTVRGEGRALVLVNGLACVDSYWKYTVEHFSSKMQVITYDLRGHGRSALPNIESNIEIADHARDLHALIRELDLDQPVVAGFSLGVQIMFEACRSRGANLGALVAVTGPYRNPIATFYGLPLPQPAIDAVFLAAKVLERPLTKLWRAVFASPVVYPISRAVGACKCSREDIQGFYDHQQQMDVGLFFRMAQAASRHTAEDVLPTIGVPVLVIGAEKDTFTPVSLSRHMADSIPDAEFLYIEGGTHTAIVEQPEVINQRIDDFLQAKAGHLFEKTPA